MATNLPDFASFDCADLSNAGPRWKKWISRFEILMSAMNIGDTANEVKRKKALLQHYMGGECFDIYSTLKADDDTYEVIKTKLEGYFVPKSNAEYEKYIFRNAKQREGETIDQFCTKLRKLAINCNFAADSVNDEIKSQIVQGCISSQLRRKALRSEMTLEALLETGKTMEISKTQISVMEGGEMGTSENVNRVFKKNYKSKNFYQEKKVKSSKTCYSCGGQFPHDGECPAKNRKCYNCGKLGHMVKCCRQKGGKKKPVNSVSMDSCSRDESDESNEYSLSVRINKEKLASIKLSVNEVSCEFLIDSGSSVNVLDHDTYNKIKNKASGGCKLQKTDKKLFAYGKSTPIKVVGKFSAKVTAKDLHTTVNDVFYVVKNANGNLLSLNAAVNLKVIALCNAVMSDSKVKNDKIINEYSDLFKGIGKLKNFQLKLNIDDSVIPVYQKHRRVPFKTRPKVERAVNKLCQDDICEKVENCPTPWVSPVVMVPKANDPENLRLCVDMRAANEAIKRVKHPLPTMDELIHDMNGYKVFSKLDLSQGYHQIELHPDSRYITVFSTSSGIYRYKRLNFGINAASEKFQMIIEQVLHGLRGVRNFSDDIIVASKDMKSHEQDLRACLDRLRESGLKLNLKKCSLFQSSISYFGHIFSENGVSPDPAKIQAINEVSSPTDKHQVKSLLGMVNYLSRFIPRLAGIVKPIRELTCDGKQFTWSSECEDAFDKLKSCLSNERTMSYFDSKLKTELLVDGSPCGLGAILVQLDGDHKRVIAYASKALSEVESRYSQIEREALAVRWAIEHFHLYLYGSTFKVVTDHKPLVHVFKSTTAKPSPRIERWCLRLQQYTFEVEYRPGVNNPADYMSRHPSSLNNYSRISKVAEEYINFVCETVCPKAITLKEVQESTDMDPVMQNVKSCLITSRWFEYKQCEEMTTYEKLAPELSFVNRCLMRGRRIIIPSKLRRKIINAAHEGHQGIVKTKALLREKVWFPDMDRLVEEKLRGCNVCSTVMKDERIRPLNMSELPNKPWECLSADFGGPYPSGDYCLVVMDEFSRFPIVEIIKSTSSRTVIPVLDKIFSVHGMPEVLKTDNGPPFQSYEFKKFMEYCGIRHRKITPLWPRANAQAESFMKPLNKAIKAANVEKKSWKQELYKFLRNYRATPHVTTNRPPAELLFGHNIKVLLPEIVKRTDCEDLRERDKSEKNKQKKYADLKHTRRPYEEIKEKDLVLIKQKPDKLSPHYRPEPMVVERIKGNMITARSKDFGTKTRNVSQFKKIKDEPNDNIIIVPDDDEDNINNNDEQLMDCNSANADVNQNGNNLVKIRPKRNRRFPSKYDDYV